MYMPVAPINLIVYIFLLLAIYSLLVTPHCLCIFLLCAGLKIKLICQGDIFVKVHNAIKKNTASYYAMENGQEISHLCFQP